MNDWPSSPPEQAPPTDPMPPSPPQPSQTPVRIPLTLIKGKPLVTYIILAITITMFILQFLSELVLGVDYPALFGMKINEFIEIGQFWRLITPLLLHGSILHITFNMYALYSLGRSLERYYGHQRFLLLYLVSGFAGNVVSFLFTASPSLGASTAIFGLIAAEGAFIFNNRKLFGRQAQRMLTNIGMIILVNLALGTSPGIDNMGHLGGLIGGLAYAWLAGPLLKIKQEEYSYQIVDQRPKNAIWLSAIGVTVLFALAVVISILI